jgi:MarR-like DNA-binding transcriptional regulator SgrR of sgrS sRNA
MHEIRRILWVAGLAAALFCSCHRGPAAPVAAPAPAPAPPAAPPPPEKTVVAEEGGEGEFALEEPFTGIAASRLATGSDRILRGLVFHGLTRLDASGKIEPELAARWETLRGGAEWVFHLRPETAFANGRYVESRHVVASWEQLLAAPEARYAWLLDALKGFDEMQSGDATHASGLIMEDGLTLRVVLTRPLKDLPFRLAHPALGISAFGEDEQGVGPFEISGTPRPQQVSLRANPEYFRGLPHMDELLFVRGEAARSGRVLSGGLDGAVLGAGESSSAASAAKIFTHSVPRTYLLGLNRAKAPFARPETAKSFLASLDRESFLREVAGERGAVPESLVPVPRPGRVTPGPREGAAGSPSGLGRLDLLLPEIDPVAAALAAKIQGQLLRAGGKVVLHPVNSADISAALARREYHLFLLPFVPSTPHPLLSYLELMQWNQTIPGALSAQARALEGEEDPSTLPAALESLDASLQLGGYLFPLVSVERRLLVRRGICGLRPDPVGMLNWTQLWVSTSSGRDCE